MDLSLVAARILRRAAGALVSSAELKTLRSKLEAMMPCRRIFRTCADLAPPLPESQTFLKGFSSCGFSSPSSDALQRDRLCAASEGERRKRDDESDEADENAYGREASDHASFLGVGVHVSILVSCGTRIV